MSIPSANHLIIFYFQRLLSSIKGKINCPSNNYFLPFKLIHFPRFRKQESGQYLYVEIGIVYKKLDTWRIFFNPCLCNLAPSWKVLEFIHYFCYHGSCFQSQWRLVAELMWFCLGREETENPLVPVYHRAGGSVQGHGSQPGLLSCPGKRMLLHPAAKPFVDVYLWTMDLLNTGAQYLQLRCVTL